MSAIKFGTDGWRDLMYDRFNLPNVLKVVQAIAKHILDHQGAGRGVVIGYDARFFSDLFAKEAARVLAANGIKVYLGERDYPTPVTAYAVKLYNAFGAIMFTASHNPPEYNGIKFIPEYAGPASPEITQEIEQNLALNLEPVKFTKEHEHYISQLDPTKEYINHLHSLVNVASIEKSGIKILVDPMYATGRGFFHELFPNLSVEELHSRRDPLFGGFMPDPQDQFLGELKSKVASRPHSIGLATDGDADRFGIVDSDGTYLTPNQVIPLLMHYLIKYRGYQGVVVRSVATTHFIDKLAAFYGVESIETPVGFKYVGEMMRKKPVIVGGEESGGLSILGHIPEKDGILACAMMAELMAVTQKSLSATLKELYQQVGEFFTKRIDIHLSDEAKQKILERLKTNTPTEIKQQKVIEVRKIDGFKFILEDSSWILIRPSGTESLIRIYLESHSIPALEELINAVQQMIDQWSK